MGNGRWLITAQKPQEGEHLVFDGEKCSLFGAFSGRCLVFKWYKGKREVCIL